MITPRERAGLRSPARDITIGRRVLLTAHARRTWLSRRRVLVVRTPAADEQGQRRGCSDVLHTKCWGSEQVRTLDGPSLVKQSEATLVRQRRGGGDDVTVRPADRRGARRQCAVAVAPTGLRRRAATRTRCDRALSRRVLAREGYTVLERATSAMRSCRADIRLPSTVARHGGAHVGAASFSRTCGSCGHLRCCSSRTDTRTSGAGSRLGNRKFCKAVTAHALPRRHGGVDGLMSN